MRLVTIFLALIFAMGFGLVFAQEGNRGVRVQGRKATDSRQRVALVIGNAQYVNISALRNPKNDALDMAAALRASGFQVALLLNGTRKGMNKAIRKFGNKLRKGGVGLFFYAGHGVQLDGVNYLIPIGADIKNEDEIEDEAVSANRVLRKMKSAGNDLNMVFLDACRNNPYKGSFRSTSRGLAAVMNAPKGSLVSYATGAGNVAADGTGRNGTYTKNLLAAINTPNLELSQLMKQVRIGVQRDTNDEQTPYELSSLTGDFYFRGGPAPAPDVATNTRASPTPTRTLNAEEEFWKTARATNDSALFEAYLKEYPNGRFAALARIKLIQAKKSDKQKAQQAEHEKEEGFWNTVKDSKDAADFEIYLKNYPRGRHADLASLFLRRLKKVPIAKVTKKSFKISIFTPYFSGREERYTVNDQMNLLLNLGTYITAEEQYKAGVSYKEYHPFKEIKNIGNRQAILKNTWTGFFTKNPDSEFIYKMGQDLKSDLVFTYYISFIDRFNGNYKTFLFDIWNERLYQEKGSFSVGFNLAINDSFMRLLNKYKIQNR